MADEIPKKAAFVLDPRTGALLNVRYNRAGNYIMTCGQDKALRLWNPHKGTHIKTYSHHSSEVLDVDIAADNGQFVSVGGDKQVFIWDVGTGNIIRKLRGHERRINCVKYNHECSLIASGSYDETVRIWDCRSRNTYAIQELKEARDSITSVIFSEFEIISSSVDGNVRVYDVREGKLRTDIIGHPATCAHVSGDGNCILVSCLDSTIRLINKRNGELLNSYAGHRNTSLKIECGLTNTDAHAASGSEDGMVYFWDLVEGNVVARLEGHKKAVTGLVLHPKLNCFVSCSLDGTVRCWA